MPLSLPDHDRVSPRDLRELVRLVTGMPVGSWIFREDDVEGHPELTRFYRMAGTTSGFSAAPYESGWLIHEHPEAGLGGSWWSTVDDASDPRVAILGIEAVFSAAGESVEPRFFATKNYPDEVSGYCELQRKIFLTKYGPVAMHLRRIDEGRLNCWEFLTSSGVCYMTFLYRFDIDGPQEVDAKMLQEPPDWVTPAFESGELDNLMEALDPPGTEAPAARPSDDLAEELKSLALGTYAIHATLPQVHMEYERTADAFERYAYKALNPDGSFRRWSLKSGVRASVSDLHPILTPEHERHHFQQLMTTPYGLFLWRLINSLTSGLQYSLQVIKEETEVAPDRLPFTAWYREVGSRLLPTAAEGGPRIAKLHRTIEEIGVMYKFLLALMGRMDLTIGQFLELANTSLAEVCRAADLPQRAVWRTNLDPDSPYLPEGYFSTGEIIEAAARFKEQGLIRGMGPNFNRELEEAWRGEAIHGIYRPAFEFLEGKLVNGLHCHFAIDLAMLGRLDPVTHATQGGEILFEATHPGWRLARIVSAMESRIYENPSKIYDWWIRKEVAREAGLEDPEETIRRAIDEPFLGPNSWGADARARGIDNRATVAAYHYRIAEKVREAFRLRVTDAALVSGHPEQRHFFHPFIEVWDDNVRVADMDQWSEDHEVIEDLIFKSFAVLCSNLSLLSLLAEGDVRRLNQVQAAFRVWIREVYDEEHHESLFWLFDPRPIAEAVVSEAYAGRLSW